MCSYEIFLCDIEIYTVVFLILRSKVKGIEMKFLCFITAFSTSMLGEDHRCGSSWKTT